MVDLLLIPVYAVIGLLVLMPLRLYSIMTARRINWALEAEESSGPAA